MWAIAAAITSTLVACAVLGGLVIRYGLVPYLEKQLINPILTQLGQVVQIADTSSKEVRVIAKAWDHHLEWSSDEVDRLWREMRDHQHFPIQRGRL